MLNERFLEEARVLEARWAATGLLNGITDRFSRSVTAIMLESQRLTNLLYEEKPDTTNWQKEGF